MEEVDGWRMVDGLVMSLNSERNRDEAEEWELAAFKGIGKLNGRLGRRPVTARSDQASSSKGQEQGGPGRDTAAGSRGGVGGSRVIWCKRVQWLSEAGLTLSTAELFIPL